MLANKQKCLQDNKTGKTCVTWIKREMSSQTISSLDLRLLTTIKNKTENPKVRLKKIALSPLKFATNLNLSLSARKDLDLGKLVNIHTVPSL